MEAISVSVESYAVLLRCVDARRREIGTAELRVTKGDDKELRAEIANIVLKNGGGKKALRELLQAALRVARSRHCGKFSVSISDEHLALPVVPETLAELRLARSGVVYSLCP